MEEMEPRTRAGRAAVAPGVRALVLRVPLLLAACFAAGSAALAAQASPLPLTVDRYELDVDIDYEAERLQGTARLVVRNITDAPVSTAPLILYRLMRVERAWDEAGSLPVEQSVKQDPDLTKSQSTVVKVRLREPLPPDSATVFTVRYGGHLLGRAETGMRYIRDRIDPDYTLLRNDGQAFPMIGNGSSMALRATPIASFDYRAEITVPDTLTVVNAGRLVSKTAEDGRATYVFESRKPSWRMDFAIGDYRTLEAGAVRIHYLASDSVGAARVARATERGLEFFAERFGPLRGDATLSVIELEAGYGSQADVAAIMQTAAAFRDSARANELYHEISHLWNPPETDYPAIRWNEGLASFLEWYAVEEIEGEEVLDWVGNWLVGSVSQALDRTPALGEVPLVGYGTHGLSQRSYGVGGLFFHLLYRLEGEAATMALVREFYQEHATTGGSAREFVALAKDRLGPEGRRLFDDWWLTTRWTEAVKQADDLSDLLAHYRS